MAIEDFEWEGELEGVKARHAEPWWVRLKQSVWLAPALRLAGMAVLLGVLSGIGVVATTYAKPGRPLPDGATLLVDALGTAWLKPSPAPTHQEKATSGARAQVAQPPANESAPTAPARESAPTAPTTESAPRAPSGITPDGKVILNVASAQELTRLPGVGAKRAEAIVALRVKLKRFRQPSDLLRVKGIGPRGLKRMLPHLVLDAPS